MKRSKEEISDTIVTLNAQIGTLLAERDRLRSKLKSLPSTTVATDSAAFRVLKDAYNNVPGWREEARTILGVSCWIDCEVCGKPFRSGGKRKKTCGPGCQFK